MGRDPAVLLYFNDWHSGTITFSRHLKGCYMDLLHAQFNSGHLSLEEIKTVLGNDFASWGALSKKFIKDDNGLFFNHRLESEIIKRKDFSKKQSDRVKKRYQKGTVDLPIIEDENKIEVRIEFKNVFEKWLNYKKGRGEKYKNEDSLTACYKKLLRLSAGDPLKAEDIIEDAMSNNYAGFFELKNKNVYATKTSNYGNDKNASSREDIDRQADEIIRQHIVDSSANNQ